MQITIPALPGLFSHCYRALYVEFIVEHNAGSYRRIA